MTRIEYLQKRLKENHAYNKMALKISESDFDRVVEFIDDNDELNHIEFEYAINRMFLDKPKPKNWTIIQELLMISNGLYLGGTKK